MGPTYTPNAPCRLCSGLAWRYISHARAWWFAAELWRALASLLGGVLGAPSHVGLLGAVKGSAMLSSPLATDAGADTIASGSMHAEQSLRRDFEVLFLRDFSFGLVGCTSLAIRGRKKPVPALMVVFVRWRCPNGTCEHGNCQTSWLRKACVNHFHTTWAHGKMIGREPEQMLYYEKKMKLLHLPSSGEGVEPFRGLCPMNRGTASAGLNWTGQSSATFPLLNAYLRFQRVVGMEAYPRGKLSPTPLVVWHREQFESTCLALRKRWLYIRRCTNRTYTVALQQLSGSVL